MGSRKNKKQKPPRLKRLRRQPNRMPAPSKPRADKKWTFSFQYWQQQKFFGLKGESQKWFISLFDRLAALSKEPLEAVRLDGGRAKAHRFHPLSWTASSAITKNASKILCTFFFIFGRSLCSVRHTSIKLTPS